MASIAVSDSQGSESQASEAPLAATLLELLNIVQAAVGRDHQAAQECLADATALLLANPVRDSASHVASPALRGGFPRWQANRLAAYIEENLSQPISTADLLALTRVSAGHFFRSFKATFGEAPFAYIARRRVERAQELMLTTNEPLCQIALACGLCDQSHLTRRFRRLVGVTPREWRREHASHSLAGARAEQRGTPRFSHVPMVGGRLAIDRTAKP
ncbi:helix-turn-helix transcriptional regulator [Steroidobacter sp. S1-65]|uniref:Helix-turn-helix transcriptional regulator n=1 Tax=Steroidobacter gossypii TaxID=2805490 RepID=A0ABS1X5S9_9GAMM|nr:AraC family transcriptional regulator [Steroidobacter gossypii]MBM0108563.1 helix-turn-helix transcriptional regulator [Steroidobacter gossypii]